MAKNWAMVIGINDYNPVNFAPLRYARQDAERVKDFFEKAGFEVCFFADNSPPLNLRDGHTIRTKPSCGDLTTFLEDRFERPFLNTGDNCWFFFAGHGERHRDRDYLMPEDANSRGEKIIGLEVNYVQERLSRCGADNVIMIIDACRSQGSRNSTGIGRDIQKGLITFSSCQPTQKSWEIEELEQGAFTFAFLEALQLPEEQNCATVERLSSYLKRRVPNLCQQYGKVPAQTPRISVDPIEKQHFILLPKHAREADINQLKLDVFRLKDKNLILAEQICIRLNALAMGEDLETINLLTEIRSQIRKQTFNEPRVNQNCDVENSVARSAKAINTTVKNSIAENFAVTSELGPATPFHASAQLSGDSLESITVGSYNNLSHSWNKLLERSIGPKELAELYPFLYDALKEFEFEYVFLNSYGEKVLEKKSKSFCLTENIGSSMYLDMVVIPSGRFLMGAFEEKSFQDELPVREVEIEGFLFAKYPITKGQWKTIANLPKVERELKRLPLRKGGMWHPVTQVSWGDANEFCRRLSKYTGKLYRLPSKAEWEYACRAGSLTPYHFGQAITSNIANYDGNYPCNLDLKGIFRENPTDVRNFRYANAFGLFDMHGNVWEWCQDSWHDNYNNAPYNGNPWQEDGDTGSRVLRGGSWVNEAIKCRSACRQRGDAEHKSTNTGFRVVREISSSSS
ncbi:SUMF1/EgtB/PvdO family nonheme iron enzyme [Nodosilinea sp. FACHB-13]|uniref:SUMF1/EgtB/PvdO family nonheme iron enzyme n=1 Tax=Cyanophyceae TaxID=3028117 RepID=UPI001685E6DD|nr:SUMF1/EgtB/PvdO family nonheme iron enzyme [Nodosilinea sp. FACHB-13]MBD2108707.1 SUMF1/EgtB/PvdO family nonheme iron enzyme [Nodosilinea sp. FACHB-13]